MFHNSVKLKVFISETPSCYKSLIMAQNIYNLQQNICQNNINNDKNIQNK